MRERSTQCIGLTHVMRKRNNVCLVSEHHVMANYAIRDNSVVYLSIVTRLKCYCSLYISRSLLYQAPDDDPLRAETYSAIL
jgi:hypothetical protein